MNILIAFDDSPCSDAAIFDLTLAGLPRVAEAVVFTVAERWLPPPAMASVLEPWDDERAGDLEAASNVASRGCKRLSTMFPEWDVRAAVYRGSPAAVILEAARQWRPDLVVVGSHGHSALARLGLGSVSRRVLAEAPCPVRVARGRPGGELRPVRLLVALDDSPAAATTVAAVAARQWASGSRADVLTVYDEPPDAPEELKEILDRIDRLQRPAASLLQDAGLEVARYAAPGNPKRLIVEGAGELQADAVYLGSHGHSALRQRVLGSVAAAVADRAPCSVEVVRPVAEPAAPEEGA